MTTATKTKPTRRLDREIAELDEHRATERGIRAEAVKADAEAARLGQEAAALISNFDRPAEGLEEEIRARKTLAADIRERSTLLQQRADAYVTQHDLVAREAAVAAEQFRQRELEVQAAARARFDGLVRELDVRFVQAVETQVLAQALVARLQQIGAELNALVRAHDLPSPPPHFDVMAGQVRGQVAARIDRREPVLLPPI